MELPIEYLQNTYKHQQYTPGQFGPVLSHWIGKNDDEEHCFLK